MMKLKYLINPEKFNHREFIHGDSRPDWEESDFKNYERDIDLSDLRTVINDCMKEDQTNKVAQAKVARKLHETLRFTKREASDATVWAYLTCVFAPDFVRWLYGKNWDAKKSVATLVRGRYMGGHGAANSSGPKDANTFRCLWWGFELTRQFDEEGEYLEAFFNDWNYYFTLARQNFHRVPTMLKAVVDATYFKWEDWKVINKKSGGKHRWKKGTPMPPEWGDRKKGNEILVRRDFYRRMNIAGSTVVFESLSYDEAKNLATGIKDDLRESLIASEGMTTSGN